ncbi:Hypothetical predicted protein [Lecanosticta acicola]|uniref:Uncharacterized protein n=1 Tax=Lecanosticta acicola TaxID=111012 RepID=A0AAI9E743_9PEZI|nr:Hypothetical predicted protein [Lecanosticta acicola]
MALHGTWESSREHWKVTKGSMRNPLSEEMYTADDVRAIVQHPSPGQELGYSTAQTAGTHQWRPSRYDLEKIEQSSQVLLADQTADAAASRKAVDEILGYLAILPETEQLRLLLKDLRVPAS